MDWNAKWDWESLEMFTSKGSESPQKHHTIDWDIIEDSTSFNLSTSTAGCGTGGGCGGGSGGSVSDVGHGSSTKSSISASTDSASKVEMKQLCQEEPSRTCCPLLEASHGSSESLTCLKLGKRTYFENSNAKISLSDSSEIRRVTSSATDTKKTKLSSCQSPPPNPRCQVEGCNLDLSSAKEYHRKHRVCETHSKSSKVIIRGLERRFCQQCSRFHNLSEFDEKKRSCRRRLSDHNARRRKPQHETIRFNSTRLCSSFYDERQQMSFTLNNTPLAPTRTAANSTWENTCSSKYTFAKGYTVKPHKTGLADRQPRLPAIQLPHSITIPNHETNSLSPCKGTNTPDVFYQGLKEPVFSSNSDAAPDLRRALSLLSTNTWGRSLDPRCAELEQTNHINLPQQQLIPLTSAEYWQASDEQYPSDAACKHLLAANGSSSSHFQEIQLFKPQFQTGFYTNPLN